MEKADFEAYRQEFPVTKKFIYLDHAGISPVSRRVENEVCQFAGQSAEYAAFFYPKWSQKIVGIRSKCAELIGAKWDEIAFIRSTSHGLSLVSSGLDWKVGDNILIYGKEFPSNLHPWVRLARKGVEVRYIASREGRILAEDIEKQIDSRTRLLSVSSVQFTNGFRLDLARTGELCRRNGVLFCVDAIQSLGVIPMDVKAYGIDFLSADAHKWIIGPEGIGIFYCRRGLAEQLDPPLVGWKSMERELSFEEPDFELKRNALRFEEGSMNLMGIFGLGAAIDLLLEIGVENIEKRVLSLGDLIIGEAEKRGWVVKTPTEKDARGGIITFAGDFDPGAMRDALGKCGVMVNVRAGGLRMSPHFYNTEGEIISCFEEIDRRRSR